MVSNIGNVPTMRLNHPWCNLLENMRTKKVVIRGDQANCNVHEINTVVTI